MMERITLGQYFPGLSPLHAMDPRVKIVLTLLMIILVFMGQNFLSYALILAFALFAAVLSEIRLKTMIRGLRPILFIVILTCVFNIFFSSEGTVLVQWGFFRLTKEGLITAAFMATRLMLLVFTTQLMTLTTSPLSLTDGLESLMRPLARFRFPAHEIAMMMSITLRFIPTLMEEADKIIKAQKARGADFESGNILKRIRAMLPLLIPLFISAFRRAEELALAMEARCYRGGANRTRMKTLQMHAVDYQAMGLFAGLTIGVLLLNRLWS